MSRTAFTYEAYAALPDDGHRYEVHDGELSVTPSPGTWHQRVKANLFDILRHHVLARRAGELFDAPLDCILSQTTIVQPDIVFVAREHAARVSPRGIEGPPTLAVEVVSPSTERIDRRRKLELYARHLIEHYWIVDPVARTIDAHTLTGQGYRLSGHLEGLSPPALDPFPDLLVDPAALWA
jgi:Uma2 family endonuclease